MVMSQDMKKWKIEEKPPASECPREFCFLWDTSEEACGSPFGLCRRLDAGHGERDFYEPHEPNLERAGLPWFYFIPDGEKLVAELRDEYERESQKLWGVS